MQNNLHAVVSVTSYKSEHHLVRTTLDIMSHLRAVPFQAQAMRLTDS